MNHNKEIEGRVPWDPPQTILSKPGVSLIGLNNIFRTSKWKFLCFFVKLNFFKYESWNEIQKGTLLRSNKDNLKFLLEMLKNKKKYNLDAYVPLRGKKEIVSLSLWEKNSKLNFLNIRNGHFSFFPKTNWTNWTNWTKKKIQITKRLFFFFK